MKKILKWIAIVIGVLVGLLILAIIGMNIAGGARANKTHDIQAENIAMSNDEATLERGEHLVKVACTGCHGQDLSGLPLIEDPAIGTVYASNLTGLGSTHSDADLVLAIRHGVDQDGRQMVIMPAESFIKFSEEDLGAIVTYLKTVPAAGNETPDPKMGPLGKILLTAGMMGQIFPAEYIDHNQPFPEMPEIGANMEYGAYVSGFCMSCHGANLGGGPAADPDSPPAPSLTPSGQLGSWSEDEFIAAMKTGTTPDGRVLDPEAMPWESFGKFDDDELKGLWLYLHSMPPSE